MSLSGLLVLHRRRQAGVASRPLFAGRRLQPFHLETCLRDLWIIDGAASSVVARRSFDSEVERRTGTRAYEFLLRIACGLESEIKGESDVFGQLRDAWRAFAADHADRVGVLEPLMQRLFEDVKDIRSRHLTGLGSTTYGGLTRGLLGDDVHAPTLVIGAGRMACAVLPYLSGSPLQLWNRSPERISELLDTRSAHSPDRASLHVLASNPEAELAAWRASTNVIVCIPLDSAHDAARVAAWLERDHQRGRLIHLGLLSPTRTPWERVAGIATLDDLFRMQATHSAFRKVRIERAELACREKANLRALGGPLSLAHGWEDLSLFASTG
jgi:glutamyl-tRNA reductase